LRRSVKRRRCQRPAEPSIDGALPRTRVGRCRSRDRGHVCFRADPALIRPFTDQPSRGSRRSTDSPARPPSPRFGPGRSSRTGCVSRFSWPGRCPTTSATALSDARTHPSSARFPRYSPPAARSCGSAEPAFACTSRASFRSRCPPAFPRRRRPHQGWGTNAASCDDLTETRSPALQETQTRRASETTLQTRRCLRATPRPNHRLRRRLLKGDARTRRPKASRVKDRSSPRAEARGRECGSPPRGGRRAPRAVIGAFVRRAGCSHRPHGPIRGSRSGGAPRREPCFREPECFPPLGIRGRGDRSATLEDRCRP
jgi:hypothetical protein